MSSEPQPSVIAQPIGPIDAPSRESNSGGDQSETGNGSSPNVSHVAAENIFNAAVADLREQLPELKTIPHMTLCRFLSGQLVKEEFPIGTVEYIAISHVWGDAKWQHVAGIEEEVMVSEEKAQFMVDQLPDIVKDSHFFMDVLCIDQRSKEARIAITQHIPRIYREAQKTVVVRTSGGFRQCCKDMYKMYGSRAQTIERVGNHLLKDHKFKDFDEGVLTRLWPLQEILLSNNLQFVRCNAVTKEIVESPDVPAIGIVQSLFSAAIVWSSRGEDDGDDYPDLYFADFTNAIFDCGSVSRSPRREVEFPLLQELHLEATSTRRTSKSRDFILAIMPQFKFYTLPEKAREMDFSSLFLDCVRQLEASGPTGSFAPLVTDYRINFLENTQERKQMEVPEPTCLGDFIKLLNGPHLTYPP